MVEDGDGGIPISADRGRSRPKMTLPMDSTDPDFVWFAVKSFRLFLTFEKLFDLFVWTEFSKRAPGVMRYSGDNYTSEALLLLGNETSHQTASFEPLGVMIS